MQDSRVWSHDVSTHSRPKAAGIRRSKPFFNHNSFNTQPPEGGWFSKKVLAVEWARFQHTAARRRLVWYSAYFLQSPSGFNTQPPEGGWVLVDIFLR